MYPQRKLLSTHILFHSSSLFYVQIKCHFTQGIISKLITSFSLQVRFGCRDSGLQDSRYSMAEVRKQLMFRGSMGPREPFFSLSFLSALFKEVVRGVLLTLLSSRCFLFSPSSSFANVVKVISPFICV